jgi:hypothetical protein
MIYAFARMVVRQGEITWKTEDAEKVLERTYPDFVPLFRSSRLSSRFVLVASMIALDVWLLNYAILRAYPRMPLWSRGGLTVVTAGVGAASVVWLWRATRRKKQD